MAHYEDIIDEQDQIKCTLCSIYITDNDYLIETHINSESHRDLEVKRYLIRNSVVLVDNNFYCNVCNKTVEKIGLKEHFQSFIHEGSVENVKSLVNADGIFLKLPEDPTEEINIHGAFINCLICDRRFEFTVDAVRYHISSDKHRRARAIAVQPLNGIFSVEGSDNDLFCKFCRVYFENYIEIIFEHVDHDHGHKTKMTKILKLIKDQNITIEKFLMDPKEDKAHCRKCNRMVACNVDNLERYIKGKAHNQN